MSHPAKPSYVPWTLYCSRGGGNEKFLSSSKLSNDSQARLTTDDSKSLDVEDISQLRGMANRHEEQFKEVVEDV